MILIVKGKKYRTDDVGKIPLSAHRQVQSEFGVGWATVSKYMATIEGAQIGDVVGVVEFQAWMLFWILAGGTALTRQQLEELTLDDIDFEQPAEQTPGDVAEALPTSAPTGSVRGAGNRAAAARRKRPSSTTSKPESQSA